jgi:hypothetical protein
MSSVPANNYSWPVITYTEIDCSRTCTNTPETFIQGITKLVEKKMPFGSSKEKSKSQEYKEPANIPPQLSDLHCFSETDGVVTTSTSPIIPGQK